MVANIGKLLGIVQWLLSFRFSSSQLICCKLHIFCSPIKMSANAAPRQSFCPRKKERIYLIFLNSKLSVIRLDFQNFDMTAGGSKEILKINSEKPTQEEIWRIGRNISTDGQFLLHKTLLYHDSSWCENYQHSPWDYSIFPDPNICRLRETRIA